MVNDFRPDRFLPPALARVRRAAPAWHASTAMPAWHASATVWRTRRGTPPPLRGGQGERWTRRAGRWARLGVLRKNMSGLEWLQ